MHFAGFPAGLRLVLEGRGWATAGKTLMGKYLLFSLNWFAPFLVKVPKKDTKVIVLM